MHVKKEHSDALLFTSLMTVETDGVQNVVNKIHLAYPTVFDFPALFISKLTSCLLGLCHKNTALLMFIVGWVAQSVW
jgi:hypothetical protein